MAIKEREGTLIRMKARKVLGEKGQGKGSDKTAKGNGSGIKDGE